MIRGLRTLAPARLTDVRSASGNVRIRKAAFSIALFSVILQFALSGNTLENLGIDYANPGGNPLVKLHPSTYLAAIGCCMVLFLTRPAGSGLVRFFRATPALAAFAIMILFCAFYSIANVGFSGAAVYVESYLAAAMLAVALEAGTDRQKRSLAWWIIGFCVLSIILSIGESATQTHLIPLHLDDSVAKEFADDIEDFRGDGLFGHPLIAAGVTSMATFMLLRMRMNGLLKGTLFTAMLIGLLSFGGRAALLTTVIVVVLAAAYELLRGILRRDLSMGFVGAVAAALVILPPLMIVLVASTDIGERIISHMYIDDSAQVRNLQWQVLNYLNLNDVLFGVPPDRLEVMKYQIGLGGATTDIENFWLLMFLNLGGIGFAVYVAALVLFIVHLGRTANHPLGWMLLISTIIIASTSNSLGRKSTDLFFMTTCIVAMTGYPKTASAPAKKPVSRDRPIGARTSRRLALQPTQVKLLGSKT
nr:VpsF family polysaccharide biosynthesis protein [uncultured Rhodopila sp.]